MEKQSSKLDIPRPNGVPSPPAKVNQRLRSFLLFSSLSFLAICSLLKCSNQARLSYGLETAGSPPLLITRPNSTITWTICPDSAPNATFYCHFLPLPLDYEDPESKEQAVIAMRMFPSTVDEGERLGSLFTNPGGPGGSGHASLLQKGPPLSTIVQGKYDIVSFDPRGINMSTPRVSCHSTQLARQLFSTSPAGSPPSPLDTYSLPSLHTNRTLHTLSTSALILTEKCRDALPDSVLRSVTTANVVHDLDRMRAAVGDDLLKYWGFSYGTTLGATYGRMYPGQVGRLVLDGVVFAPEQYSSLLAHGQSAGVSTQDVLEKGFLTLCSKAGPRLCPFSPSPSASPEELSHLLRNLSISLLNSPLPLPLLTPPSVLLPSDLTSAVFSYLYRPGSWAALGLALNQTLEGDGHALKKLAGGVVDWDWSNATDLEKGEEKWGKGSGRELGASEGGMAVSCGDVVPFGGEDFEEGWEAKWLEWEKDIVGRGTRPGGSGWFEGIVRCRHWNLVQPPPLRFDGHWTIEEGATPPKNPILFVSNTYDPITPISSGRRSVELFGKKNARLLQNNGFGHCSTNHPSLCTAKAVRGYLLTGELPQEGLVCEPEEGFIFPDSEKVSTFESSLEEEDATLFDALAELSRVGVGIDGW